jgi:ABC-type molybdate transport system ATPase subunit
MCAVLMYLNRAMRVHVPIIHKAKSAAEQALLAARIMLKEAGIR